MARDPARRELGIERAMASCASGPTLFLFPALEGERLVLSIARPERSHVTAITQMIYAIPPGNRGWPTALQGDIATAAVYSGNSWN
jgi:hypothetical protein